MDLIDLPLTTYLLILFGLLALTFLIRGLRMPQNYQENQKTRSQLRKKLFLKTLEEQNVSSDQQNDQDN
jgi:ABC-type transport system involved in cytochrome bd biosynthesis fused ATPase/permease subunit